MPIAKTGPRQRHDEHSTPPLTFSATSTGFRHLTRAAPAISRNGVGKIRALCWNV
jgi:hypothetical protein